MMTSSNKIPLINDDDEDYNFSTGYELYTNYNCFLNLSLFDTQ